MIGRYRGRARWSVLPAVLVLLNLTGCGGNPPTAESTIDEINKTFASCDHPTEVSVEPVDYISQTTAWLDVVEVVTADRDGSADKPSVPSRVVVSERSRPTRASSTVTLIVHFAYWPAVDWALANGSQVWFGLADPAMWNTQGTEGIVGVVVIVLPDGRVFFPGSCQEKLLYQPLKQQYGDSLDSVMRGAVGRLGDDLRASLGMRTSSPTESNIVILNPQDVPPEVLAPLKLAVVQIRISEPLGQYVIATRIQAGWNDGLPTDEGAARTGYAIGAYLDGGPLEVWLLNAYADVSRPLALLGTLTVPPSLDSVENVALRVEVDFHGLTGAALAAGAATGREAVLVEAIPTDEIAPNDPDWPSLAGEPEPGAVGPATPGNE